MNQTLYEMIIASVVPVLFAVFLAFKKTVFLVQGSMNIWLFLKRYCMPKFFKSLFTRNCSANAEGVYKPIKNKQTQERQQFSKKIW